MLNVQSSALRLLEYSDPQQYAHRVGRWMELREAENCYILGSLPELIANASNPNVPKPRLFALEDGHVLAAAVLYPGGCAVITWASSDMIGAMADGLRQHNCGIASVLGPGHVSREFSALWAQNTGQHMQIDRAERIYQLAHLSYSPPTSGRLVLATPDHAPLVTTWLTEFIREAELENQKVAEIRDSLIRSKQLFLWTNPEPVSMAAWVAPTRNGACINMVFTPRPLRNKGHGTAVVAALSQHMLANGQRFCFIITDPADRRTHALYQRIGGRTMCELLRCKIVAVPTAISAPQISAQGRAL